ncbi:hypothetical protein [Armatimonas sp.]|uniref:hypothetical protein n=1 Tax=Armatimonas sp. TaxID=1872638 RepID=UPI003750DEAB
MDRTNWKWGIVHLNILMLCIVEGYIGFPLTWFSLEKQGKGNTNSDERITLMKSFVKIFGAKDWQFLSPKNKNGSPG